MLGIIVQLAISWLIIWFFEKKNLSVLGFRPNKERILAFLLFFFISAAVCSAEFLLKMYLGKQEWRLNPDLSIQLIAEGVWWNIKSVLFEELIFRGVLLYILIKKLGNSKGIILSATAFGIYHWFSFGAFGNPMAMIFIFVITGIMGLLLAYGYTKTFSLYIPIGVHLGWNLTNLFVFSQGTIGNGVFIQDIRQPFRTDSYLIFFLVTFLPMIILFVTDYLLLRRRKQV
jgi:membrane protease YdiL (CAAX protease family)